MRPTATAATLSALLCLTLLSCQKSGTADPPESPGQAAPQLTEVDELNTVELIALLAHRNELTRTRAHQQLHRSLVTDTGAAGYADRLTQFQKYAPHACKADHEAQTLHILGLFAAQQDLSSVLLKQCLRSPHPSVRATALELAHFSDNQIDETLLTFEPDPATLASYRIALQKLGTPQAKQRLQDLGDE